MSPWRLRVATMNTVQDDAVIAGASDMQTVSAADGRTLTIAEWGNPDGFPVFLLHGTPGSRFAGQADASAYASVGAWVITYDRPGYGGSDRFRGRRVVDSVADVPRSQTASVSFGSP
jgi:pimeloyl-ACP methyl ester carboxylesterase